MARKGNKYQKDDKLKLGGIHIYEDSHGRAVYYDVFTKCGYVLDDREQAYRPYAMRFVIGIFAAVLTYMFELPLWMCLGLGVVAYGVMEVKFRKFLKTVPQMIDFKPKKRIGLVESAADDTKNRICIGSIDHIKCLSTKIHWLYAGIKLFNLCIWCCIWYYSDYGIC